MGIAHEVIESALAVLVLDPLVVVGAESAEGGHALVADLMPRA
jgi:hypothetical protein